jgi:uncharacterized protein (TIGR02996 family)
MPPALLDILLQAVREAPADDAPRLVLADWCLDQEGPLLQARGEFIHVQLQLTGIAEHDRRRAALVHREQELRARCQADWLGPLAALVVDWRRGMPALTLPAANLDDPSLGVLNTAAEAAWLTGLTVEDVTPQAAQALAGWPWLGKIVELTLLPRQVGYWWGDPTGIGDTGAEALAGSPHLPRLGSLALPRNRLSPAGLRPLVRSALLDRITELNLAHNDLGDEGARVLAASPRLAGLRSVDLTANHVGEEGGLALAGSPHLGGAQHLHLGGNHLTAATALALAGGQRLAPLRTLDLSDSALGVRGVRALATAAALTGLVTLELNRTGAGDSGAVALAGAAHMTGLRVLGLAGNSIYHHGALALADARHLRRLRLLRLENNLIGSTAAHALRMLFDDRVTF